MSYPPRHGMPMFMGVPPPGLLSGPHSSGNFYTGGPPPARPIPLRPPSHVIQGKPIINQLPHDHPSPIPMSVPSGPPVTVFVGNITEKWPDAMMRQLLSTCGYVLNWKRVQGASGKLQGFGFCEYGGADAGLRAVRLLHELEVGEKKLVVKVDAKTSSVFEEFKAEKKKKIEKGGGVQNNGEEYMDTEMKESDERSRMRINMLFREFKTELDTYQPAGGGLPEKDPAVKQAIQEKLHLLKLTSLDAPPSDADAGDDASIEEGKREIISQEIVKFREHMKIEKEKEEQRKRISKERRDRQAERDIFDKSRRDRDEGSKSPGGRRRDRRRSRSQSKNSTNSDLRSRSRSRLNDGRDGRHIGRRELRRSEERVERVPRDGRDRGERDRINRRRSRDRRSRSRHSRDRSPAVAPHKRRYREREEEEEAEDQRRLEKKAREKAVLYEEKLRRWEEREEKKRRERQKEKEKVDRQLEQISREARNMKEFLEDYDDDQLDSKYYKGKELQKRLSDRTKELESDNRDRQREREELEDMRLKVLTSGGVLPGTGVIPVITLDRHVKKPMVDTTNTTQISASPSQILQKKTPAPITSVASRLQVLAGQPLSAPSPNQLSQNGVQGKLPQTSFVPGQFNSFGSKGRTSNPTTPNSLVSPGGAPIVEMSPSVRSLTNTGFVVTPNSNSNIKDEDEGTRNSYSSNNSPGMPSPSNFERDDDSSLQDQDMSPDFQKKKKMDVKDVFNQDEEDDGLGTAKKRKLVPLDYGDGGKGKREHVGGGDDKKKSIKSLIDRIPTEKDALFSYEIDWTMVDTALMEKRIRPWINKKIIEYIGEPEPTLVEFICTKVLAKSNPAGILEDVQMVLDDEAEVFVVKMWRLLVYEIEAKKIGLASKP